MNSLNKYVGTGLTRKGNWIYLIEYDENKGRGKNWNGKDVQILEFEPITAKSSRWIHMKDGDRTVCGYPLNNPGKMIEYSRLVTEKEERVTCKRCLELMNNENKI